VLQNRKIGPSAKVRLAQPCGSRARGGPARITPSRAATASTSEIGVRIALGAARLAIVRVVVAQAVRSLLLGAVPGLVMASLVGRLIRNLLYGVGGTDWVSLSIDPVLLLMAVGLLAALGRRFTQRLSTLRKHCQVNDETFAESAAAQIPVDANSS
jgi:hypothetical protein